MTPKYHIDVRVSPSLGHDLEKAREASGRTLTAEVEARLRDSLDARTSNGLMLLRLDSGLMAWLLALDKMRFFGLNLEGTVMYLLRSAVLNLCENRDDHGRPSIWWQEIVDALPEPYRSANQATPLYKRMNEKR